MAHLERMRGRQLPVQRCGQPDSGVCPDLALALFGDCRKARGRLAPGRGTLPARGGGSDRPLTRLEEGPPLGLGGGRPVRPGQAAPRWASASTCAVRGSASPVCGPVGSALWPGGDAGRGVPQRARRRAVLCEGGRASRRQPPIPARPAWGCARVPGPQGVLWLPTGSHPSASLPEPGSEGRCWGSPSAGPDRPARSRSALRLPARSSAASQSLRTRLQSGEPAGPGGCGLATCCWLFGAERCQRLLPCPRAGLGAPTRLEIPAGPREPASPSLAQAAPVL